MKGCAHARPRFETEEAAFRADMAYCTTKDGSRTYTE